MQDRKKDTDMYNGLLDSEGEGEGGMIWENGIETCMMVKDIPAMQETQVRSLGWEDPLQRECLPTLVFLPGEFHGQRSLEGYSPCDCKKMDTAK